MNETTHPTEWGLVDQLCSQLVSELIALTMEQQHLKPSAVQLKLSQRVQSFQTDYRCFKHLKVERSATIMQMSGDSLTSGKFTLSYDQYSNMYCTYTPNSLPHSLN